MRRFALTFTLLAVACTEAPAGEGAGNDPKQAPRVTATRVEAATIHPSSASMRLVRPGEVEPTREANVAASMGGLIEMVDLSVGDRVEKGQLLAKVDTSLQAANQSLAKVELTDARREQERLSGLGRSVTKVRVDAAKTRVARAKAQLRIAQIQSSRTLVRAPFDGVVADVEMEEGEVAPPGAVIARIVQLDPALVSVSVTDRDVGSLIPGTIATLTTGGNATPIEAKVARIDPTANLKTRAFQVELEVPNPDGSLRPGMIASVEFRETMATDQIIVPQEFLVTKLEDNGVFVVDESSVARWQSLTLGAIVRDQVVVASGLSAGDNMVILGHRSLADGDPLIVARQGRCCTDGRVSFPRPGETTVASVTDEERGQ